MTAYNIPLRVKLSNKEYDKLKNVENKSKYVRNAINSYNSKSTREIELSKKKLLKDIIDQIEKENETFYEDMINNEIMKDTKIMNKLNDMYDKCEEELTRLAKESSLYEEAPFEKFDTMSTEDKILSILPTLQGIYHSDMGLTYESIRRQAVNIGIGAKELKNWIDANPELINESDYLYRDSCKSNNIKKHRFEHDC